jgi:hypothetical protein
MMSTWVFSEIDWGNLSKRIHWKRSDGWYELEHELLEDVTDKFQEILSKNDIHRPQT